MTILSISSFFFVPLDLDHFLQRLVDDLFGRGLLIGRRGAALLCAGLCALDHGGLDDQLPYFYRHMRRLMGLSSFAKRQFVIVQLEGLDEHGSLFCIQFAHFPSRWPYI